MVTAVCFCRRHDLHLTRAILTFAATPSFVFVCHYCTIVVCDIGKTKYVRANGGVRGRTAVWRGRTAVWRGRTAVWRGRASKSHKKEIMSLLSFHIELSTYYVLHIVCPYVGCCSYESLQLQSKLQHSQVWS